MSPLHKRRKRSALHLVDPHAVQEAFANRVVLRVRDGLVHLTLCASRPSGTNENGEIVDEHVVTGRAVMSIATLSSLFQTFQQIQQRDVKVQDQPAAQIH